MTLARQLKELGLTETGNELDDILALAQKKQGSRVKLLEHMPTSRPTPRREGASSAGSRGARSAAFDPWSVSIGSGPTRSTGICRGPAAIRG